MASSSEDSYFAGEAPLTNSPVPAFERVGAKEELAATDYLSVARELGDPAY